MKKSPAVVTAAGAAPTAAEEDAAQRQAEADRKVRQLWAKIPRKDPRYRGEAGAAVYRATGKRQVLSEYPDAGKEPETYIKDTVTNMMLLCFHLDIDWDDLIWSAKVHAMEEERIDQNARDEKC